MRCLVCEKESNNRRVCPYCFTPYPEDADDARGSTGAGRQSTGTRQSTGRQSVGAPRQSGTGQVRGSGQVSRRFTDQLQDAWDTARDTVMRQTPIVRWTGLGIVLILGWWVFGASERIGKAPAGSVPSAIIATPMQREEAVALIKQTRETALVEEQADEVYVSYPAATFPLLDEGQIALAQQFARADEIVMGRKRRIFFNGPNGRLFAQSDGVTGVTVVR